MYEASNKGFVFHPDGLHGPTQPHTVRRAHRRIHTHIHTNTETQKCNEKRKEMEEKNLDPSGGLCVGTGEQFVLQNSHYQHSAAGLQLAGVERSVARPNERLIFLPFCYNADMNSFPQQIFLLHPVYFSNFCFSTQNSPQI